MRGSETVEEFAARDWPYEMWVLHADLWVRVLESMLDRARKEVEAVVKVFSKHGVPEGGRVLDLCCGIGRHSVHLAAKGYRVVGVDLSPTLIDRAKELARSLGVEERATFVVADARRVVEALEEHAGTFDAVINMYTSLGYYDEEVNELILRNARSLSKPGGLLIIDVVNRDWIVRNFQRVSLSAFGDLEVLELRELDAETSTLHCTFKFYERRGEDLKHRATVNARLRLYSLHELVAILRKTGWAYLEAYGSLNLEPFTVWSSRIVAIAKAY